MSEHRIVEPAGAQHVDRPSDARRARRRDRGTLHAPERSASAALATTSRWAGSATTITSTCSTPKWRIGAVEQRDVADVGRIERAAEDAESLVLQGLLADDLDLVARARARLAQRLLQLRLARRRPGDPVAAVGAENAKRRAAWASAGRRGTRSCSGSAGASGSGGTSEKSARRNASTPSPVAQLSRNTASTPGGSNAGGFGQQVDLVQNHDLGQLIEAGAVATKARREWSRSAPRARRPPHR